MRALWLALGLVGALAVALWLVALFTAAPPPAVSVFALGEPTAVVGEPWPVRFGAVRERGLGLAPLQGRVVGPSGELVDASGGFARVTPSTAGPLSALLEVCLDGGAPCVRARIAATAALSRPPSTARFAWLGPEPTVATLTSVARRTAVAVRAPAEVEAAAAVLPLEVERAAGPILLDVLVDGVLREVVRADAPELSVALPRDLRPGAVIVVHAGGPFPSELGAWATTRVRDPAEALPAFATRLAPQAGAPAELRVATDDEARALLRRLKPATLRAPRLAVELLPDEQKAPWPELYAGAAALLVGMVAAAGRAKRVPPLPLAAGAGAVAAICAGLYVVLRVLAG